MKKLGRELAKNIIHGLEKAGKPLQQRRSLNENTFGGDTTVGYRLKRKGAYFVGDVPADQMYGVYLGECKGSYHVGVLNFHSKTDYNSTEVFDTLEELQQHWGME
jgi:hypothetical protein